MSKKGSRPKAVFSKHKYALKFIPAALSEWRALDGSVKEPLRQVLKARLDNPHVPGSALRGDLREYYKIKLLKQGYRLVYGVEDDTLVVMVMAVDKREDSVVYAAAVARLVELAEERAQVAPPPPSKSKAGTAVASRLRRIGR